MFINEQNGAQMWTKMLKENFNVTDVEKLNWVSQYAAIHEIHESMLGVGGAAMNVPAGVPAGAPYGQGVIPSQGVGPMYATPLNTLGMGNPAAPGELPTATTAPGEFFKQAVGSGDIPVSTLPMALNVALLTIGLELVPVIPAKAPWAMLSYMDFPYAGGKLGRRNEIAGLDGVGEGAENKPLYVKFLGEEARRIAKDLKEGDAFEFAGFKGIFKQYGRMDGGVIVAVKEAKLDGENASIIAVTDAYAASTTPAKDIRVDFAQTMVDFVDGFANFATGKKEAMTRAQNETGTGNTIGLRLFSKWIQMGSYEVTGTVTRQQLQDLPLYGTDAQAKVMEALQNEITQSINARILEHVFALGVTNAANQRAFQHVDLNLWMGTTDVKLAQLDPYGKYVDIYGHRVSDDTNWEVKNAEVNTSAENLATRQRRISSRILAAANLIQAVGRRGRATWVVTNAQVATALQDVSGYVVNPMANNLSQDGSQNLFLNGTLAGLKVYVDPYMEWDDCRICVGRKGNGNEPGVIFMPYILADTVSITAEGTMAPKMLVNSRYAIADAGFYPETQYYTFCVGSAFGLI